MQDNAKTLSLICTPSCDDLTNIKNFTEHSQRSLVFLRIIGRPAILRVINTPDFTYHNSETRK